MGLLDQILGGAVGGALGRGSPFGRSSIGGGKGRLVMVLLPLVLQMLANRRRAAPAGGAGAPAAGGRDVGRDVGGGGGVGGGVGRAGAGGVAGGGFGGLAGLIERLTRRGFGKQAQSWVSTGANDPMPREAVDDLFEPQQLSAIAAEAGVDEDEVRAGLAEVLPEVVDRLTPAGQVPGQDELLASIDDFEKRLQP